MSNFSDYMNTWLNNPLTQVGMGLLGGNYGRNDKEAFANAMRGGLLGMESARRNQIAGTRLANETAWQRMQQQQAQTQQQQIADLARRLGLPPNTPPEAVMATYKQSIAGPNQTSLMQNLAAAGLQPGTPAYQSAMLQAINKPQVSITQSPKPGDKYRFVDPNNPSAGVEPTPGGAADPSQSEAYRTKAEKMDKVLQSLNSYEDTLSESGTEFLPGTQKSKLSTSFGDLRIEMKELYELGALSGPDMELIDSILTDPTSMGANIHGVVEHFKKGDGTTSLTNQLGIIRNKVNAARQRLDTRYGVKKRGKLSPAEQKELDSLRQQQSPTP